MNRKELFTIKPFESLFNFQTPLLIEERPNSSQDQLKQDFNLLHNNVYIDLKDYQSFIREGIPDTKITNRGSIINQDYFQVIKKFPNVIGTPYFELFTSNDEDYFNIYQESSFISHSTFLEGISVDNDFGINIIDKQIDGIIQTKLKMEYDEGFDENVLSVFKLPEPENTQDLSEYYQSLKVKDLFILGTTYFTNVEDLFLQDPIVDLNKLQDGTTPQEQNTGFVFNEPETKYGKFIFNPDYNGENIQQFVLTEKGYKDLSIETFQDLILNNLNQVGLLNSPLLETSQISSIGDTIDVSFNTIQNIGNELLINKSTSKVEIVNLLESNNIKTNHVYQDSSTQFNQEQEQFYFNSQLNNFIIDKFTFLNNKLLIDDTTLKIQNSLEQEIQLNIIGNLDISNNTSLNNLTVSNNISVQSNQEQTFTSNGYQTFNSGQDFNNGVTISNGQNIDTQTISGQISQGQQDLTSTINGNIVLGTLGNTLTVINNSVFTGNIELNSGLTQNQDVQLNSDSITIGNIDQIVDVNGDVNLSSSQKNTTINGNLIVNENQNFLGNFLIDNTITQQNFVSTDSEQTNNIIGDINLSEQGKLTTVLGQFEQNEVSRFNDLQIFNGDIQTKNNQTIGQNQDQVNTINGTVNLSNSTKKTTVNGELDVNQDQEFYGKMSLFTGNFEVYDTLNNLKMKISSSNVINNLQNTFNENLTVNKNIINNNTLSSHKLSGTVNLGSIGKNINILGNNNIDGTLNVEGKTTQKDIDVQGEQIFTGTVLFDTSSNISFSNVTDFIENVNFQQDKNISIGNINMHYDTQSQTLIIE